MRPASLLRSHGEHVVQRKRRACDGVVMGDVSVHGNDDGMGGKTTLECIETNKGL
jgi:hypothetical protein